MTKKYRRLWILFTILSWASTLIPIIVYAIIGFVQGGTKEKVCLSLSIIVAICLYVMSILFKYSLRSPIFLLLLGIYVALKEITVTLLIVSILTIIDEFIFIPLAKRYRNLTTINKEIDKRLPNDEGNGTA